MLLGERYRLELHWDSAEFTIEGVCKLKGAFFEGPALNDAEKVNDNDNIMLDFFQQYFVLVRNVYVAKLSWHKVIYKDSRIYLDGAVITHATELNRVPKLNDLDYLVIDTKGHEAEEHQYNCIYKTYVVNTYDDLYNFRSK